MLSVLSRKLTERNLSADVLCQDVCELSVPCLFDLAILPFQSFMEIVGEKRQRDALAAVFAALNPNGRFICTMHNPAVRRSSVDGTLRVVGDVPLGEGTLVVSGFERGGDPIVRRLQFFEYYSAGGALIWKRILPMQFQFIEAESFQRMAEGAGFTVDDLLGDYRGTPFDADLSPV
ncbi:class I SAM-dependent methyltransferase, partial [Roseiconus nitratireducens]